MHSFIAKKRDRGTHSDEDIHSFVEALSAGRLADYQVSAWLMAAHINGLNESETSALALAMANSGEIIDLEGLPKPVIDKHSTGGVGDAVTPLFLPIMAACGVPVVKMSGRGLGFTGGTLDKLSAIPGFRTDLSQAELVKQAKRVGCAWGGQTTELAPADKILYALRDATETVDSTPLIAASVMSKKLASGADGIVLDVKCGGGAFAKTLGEAKNLARAMVRIGESNGRKMRVLITDMNQPLAHAIGNALEVKAAFRELRGGCKGRLGRVTLALCKGALELAGSDAEIQTVISSGAAIAKMLEWIFAQGGDPRCVEDDSALPTAPIQVIVVSDQGGYVAGFDCERLGEIARDLGAGRLRKDDEIDLSVGLEVSTEIGRKVDSGQPLFTIHAKTEADAAAASERLQTTVHFAEEQPPLAPLVRPV
ncbi:MAG: thymidine phosphorylase [Fimbriimonadales bacterium]